VAEDALVDRTPPRTTGTVTERWLQHTPPQLPAHERHRRPAKRKMPGCLAKRTVVAALHQSDPTGWVVADRGHLLLGPGCGRNPGSHVTMIAPPRADLAFDCAADPADPRCPARRACADGRHHGLAGQQVAELVSVQARWWNSRATSGDRHG